MEFTAKQPLWSLIESEIEQINNFDIPYFKMPVKSCTLELQNNNETIPVLPGYQLVNDRISDILNHDTSIFEEYIRTSCHLWSLRFNNNLPFDLRQNNEDPIRSLGDTELLKASEKICNQLQRRSIGDSQIGIGWLGLNLVGESSSLDLSPIDFNLYGGNSGLGLLFAANASILEEHSKDSSNSVQLALDSFLPIIEMIDFLKQSTNKHTNFPMGGFNGIGSIIYSLALSGLILDNPDWINHSIDLASLIRADDILTDTKLDLMSGCAGTLLSLISLNKIRSNQAIQDSICLCGEKLLSSQQEITTGKYSWRTLDNQPLTGFSHGAAGISLALFKLYELSLDKKYHDAALKAIVYENSEFSSQLNNWNDLRLGSTGSMVSWCNGACGIGLARLAILDICKEDIIMDDIKRAIEITLNDRTTYLHQICCGSMGHVELFLKAGIDLNDQSLINCARARATNILNTSSLNGGYNLLPRVPAKLIYPGFFQGRAGIAYELLRLINPYKLPCVLTLDLPI